MLARDLGVAHPDRLLASLTSKQLIEWVAFYKLEQDDERRGLLASKVKANLLGRRGGF